MKPTVQLLSWGVRAIVIGAIALLMAVPMRSSAIDHQAQYETFQRCMREGSVSGFCLLDGTDSGASSASAYKANVSNQLLLSSLGLLGGPALLVAGVTLVAVGRRRREDPSNLPAAFTAP
jgi:hypothetical protein